jgi:phage baseplate assembly protein W
MANVLEKFQKNIIGSKGRVIDYIPTVSSSGDFSLVSNTQTILNSWNNILLTQVRTYVGNPEYGSELYKFVFEPADQDTIDSIINEIQYRLMLYDDRALVTNVEVSFMNNGHGFIADIELEYNGEQEFLSVEIDSQNILKFDS